MYYVEPYTNGAEESVLFSEVSNLISEVETHARVELGVGEMCPV